MKKIHDKVWFLLGFLLQTAVGGVDGSAVVEDECPGECCSEKCCEHECCQEGCCGETVVGHDFGWAIHAVKQGTRMRRAGWNGKGMYVFLAKGIEFATDADLSEFKEVEEGVEVGDVLVLRTAQGTLQPGWLASQADMLAEDWEVAE